MFYSLRTWKLLQIVLHTRFALFVSRRFRKSDAYCLNVVELLDSKCYLSQRVSHTCAL